MLSQDIVNSGCLSSSFAVGRSSPLHSRHRSMTSRIAGHTLSGIGGGFVVEAICQRESKLSFHTGQSKFLLANSCMVYRMQQDQEFYNISQEFQQNYAEAKIVACVSIIIADNKTDYRCICLSKTTAFIIFFI